MTHHTTAHGVCQSTMMVRAGMSEMDIYNRTRHAIERFQRDSGIAITGRIDRSLLAALGRG